MLFYPTDNSPSNSITSPTTPDMDRLSEKLSSMSCSNSSSSSVSSFSCSSLPSDSWLEEIERYKPDMPGKLQIGFYDVLILYCEDNRREAIKFRDHLRAEIDIEGDYEIKAVLYDEAELQVLSNMQIGHLAAGVERSTFVFIFVTKQFTDDSWMEFSSEACLMEAITNPSKQWCVVPVYTERKGTTFRVPMSLNTLKGINYFTNDRFYRKGVAALINGKIKERVRAEEKQRLEQKKWIENHKREMAAQRENELRVKRIEEETTRKFQAQIKEETDQIFRQLPHSKSFNSFSSPPSDLSMSHSESMGSLKPVSPQNAAVNNYFQELRTEETNTLIRKQSTNVQMVPAESELGYSAEGHSSYGDNMKKYPSQGQSSIYGDMGFSSAQVFQVRSPNFPTTAVDVPSELWEAIKHLSHEHQEGCVRQYFEAQQRCYNTPSQTTSVDNPGAAALSAIPHPSQQMQSQQMPQFSLIEGAPSYGYSEPSPFTMMNNDMSMHHPSGIQHGFQQQSLHQTNGEIFGVFFLIFTLFYN